MTALCDFIHEYVQVSEADFIFVFLRSDTDSYELVEQCQIIMGVIADVR